MAAHRNLATPIWRGDSFAFPLRFMDHGVPVSIEGKIVRFTLKLNPYTPDAEAELQYEVTLPESDAAANVGDHRVVLLPSQTSVLVIANYTYQVQLITVAAPENIEVTYLWGKAPVKDS